MRHLASLHLVWHLFDILAVYLQSILTLFLAYSGIGKKQKQLLASCKQRVSSAMKELIHKRKDLDVSVFTSTPL